MLFRATRMQNRNMNALYRNGIYIPSCHQYSNSDESSSNWKCSNRVLTCIVITILPIAITSTLICIFMMQKTNLHEYAIYTFVVFCVAFVFPFALFFFTVILNKVYKLYKRENDRSLITDQLNHQLNHQMNHQLNHELNHNTTNNDNNEFISLTNNRLCQSPSPFRLSRIRDSDADYYSFTVSPYCFSDERMTVRLSPENQMFIEDAPPSYEMAIMCPNVQLTNPSDIVNDVLGQRQPPPPYDEKIMKENC